MIKIKYKKLIYIVFTLGICISLFLYVILRAYYLSFTCDESLSYFIFKEGIRLNSANHHILNTFLMGVSCNLFGDSELALRLPNVLSFGLYLFGCFLILKKSRNKWFVIIGGSLLLFNPILIEFFALARGYGLSLGFVIISLFFLLKRNFVYLSYKLLIEDFIFSMIFALPAIYANLSTINYYIAILLIFTIQYFFLLKKNPTKDFKIHFGFIGFVLASVIPLYFCVKRLLLLNELSELFFGTDSLISSIDSLIYYSLYFSEYPSWIFVAIKLGVIVSLPLGFVLILIKKPISLKFLKIYSLIIILIIGVVFEHYLFNSKYPYGRTAFIFIPIFSFFVYYFLDSFIQIFKTQLQSYSQIIISIIVFSMLIFHFSSNLGLKYSKTWTYDSHNKDIMEIIDELTHNEKTNKTISNNWIFESSINYYIDSKSIKLNLTNINGVDSTTDFVYGFTDSLNLKNYQTLIKYEDIGTSLYIKTKNSNK